MLFEELPLKQAIQRAIKEMGYEKPTPIQTDAIPIILEGHDLIGTAQTGTGKTGAFALPILERLGEPGQSPRCLVLVPTRELAAQVEENFRIYGKYLGLRCVLLHGGVKYQGQLKKLDDGVDIIVATPGRLLDHIGQGNLSLKSVEMLVLDEVDRMFDMGFVDDVSRIIRYCKNERQTLFFSATFPDSVKRLASWALNSPREVKIAIQGETADTVYHAVYPVDSIQKYDLLLALLNKLNYESVLVFTRTKRDADRIAEWLLNHQHKVATMHADRSQRERMQALEGFKSGEFEVLVATDIAARGLDIATVTHVINYNVPQHAEDYVHRIGRTGRALKEGEAYTILAPEELAYLNNIEKFIKKPIPRLKLDDFPYRTEPSLESVGGGTSAPTQKRRNRGYAPSSQPFSRRR